MKKIAALLLLATAIVSPSFAMAKDVTVSARLINYSGNSAYLAVYLTDANGSLQQTLWLAGSKTRYYGDLRGWVRSLGNATSVNIDGVTGASVGGGQTLTVKANIADNLIDAGYQIHIDTAVEHGGEYADDAVIPLTSAGGTVDGTGYLKSATLSL